MERVVSVNETGPCVRTYQLHTVQQLFPHGSWTIRADANPWVMGDTPVVRQVVRSMTHGSESAVDGLPTGRASERMPDYQKVRVKV